MFYAVFMGLCAFTFILGAGVIGIGIMRLFGVKFD